MSDINFISALEKDFENDCSLLGNIKIPEFIASNKFKTKMKKLIKSQNKPYYRFVSTAGRRVACIAAALLILSVSSLSVKSVRKALVSTFKIKGFSNHVNLTYSSQEDDHYPETIETEYEITNIPDEFELVDYNKSPSRVFAYYTYENYEIAFTQNVKSGYRASLDNEQSTISYYNDPGGNKYIVQESEKYHDYSFAWDNGEYVFEVSSNLDKNTVLDLCRSTKPK